MSDNSAEFRSRMREAENKARTAEAELKDVKGRRLKLAVWSAIGGFLLFAVGGQWFPGYQLDSTARATANKTAVSAVSEVMAQLCAERFMSSLGLEARLAALDGATGDWSKATYIRDGTWAATPDGTPDGERADHATAEKCRSLIAERVTGESGKTS
jgi:hypothetical protein